MAKSIGSRDAAGKAKRCSGCRKVKPLDQFHRSSAAPDGLGYHCKTCARLAAAKYEHSKKGKATRAKRKRDLAFLEAANEASKTYYRAHRGARLEYHRRRENTPLGRAIKRRKGARRPETIAAYDALIKRIRLELAGGRQRKARADTRAEA